jgi:Methylase involved in ubiquinone/menaquinone biosynthesis
MLNNKDIDHGAGFDWGNSSEEYARFRDIYPDAFYEKIVSLGLCLEGQRVLDLGTGTGVLPRNMQKYGAEFIGSDVSEKQIEQARRLSVGMDIEYIVSSAEELDFPEESFDVVTACQCFEYFDTRVVLPKLHKILKDGGRFCVLYMSWLSDECEIAKRSEELILKYNPQWSGAGIQRHTIELPDCSRELFSVETQEVFDVSIPFTRESWHGRMKACRGTGASSLSAAEIAAWEREHIEYLRSVPLDFEIPHFVSVNCFGKSRG